MGIFDLSKYSLAHQLRDSLDSYVYVDDNEDVIIKFRYEDGKTTILKREDNGKLHNTYEGYFHDDGLELEPHCTNSDLDRWHNR